MPEHNSNNISYGLSALLPALPKGQYWYVDSNGISIYSSEISEWSPWKEVVINEKRLTATAALKYMQERGGVSEAPNGKQFRYEFDYKTVSVKEPFFKAVASLLTRNAPAVRLLRRFRTSEIFVTVQPQDSNGQATGIIRDNLVATGEIAYAIWLDKQTEEFSLWLEDDANHDLWDDSTKK